MVICQGLASCPGFVRGEVDLQDLAPQHPGAPRQVPRRARASDCAGGTHLPGPDVDPSRFNSAGMWSDLRSPSPTEWMRRSETRPRRRGAGCALGSPRSPATRRCVEGCRRTFYDRSCQAPRAEPGERPGHPPPRPRQRAGRGRGENAGGWTMKLLHRDIVCRQAVALASDCLDGALTPRERRRLERHLAACDGCDAYLAQLRETIAASGPRSPKPSTPRWSTVWSNSSAATKTTRPEVCDSRGNAAAWWSPPGRVPVNAPGRRPIPGFSLDYYAA